VNEPGSLEIIKGTILEKDIGLLVNNVHYAPKYTEFHKNTESDIEKTINVNIKTMVFLTSVVLPQMLSK
jgi:short-subunit dehydrogenase